MGWIEDEQRRAEAKARKEDQEGQGSDSGQNEADLDRPVSEFPRPSEIPPMPGRGLPAAFRHGLYSTRLLAPNETAEGFAEFRAGLIKSLQPEGEAETYFVETFVSAAWRLQRIAEAEAAAVRRIQWAALTQFDEHEKPSVLSPEEWELYRNEYASVAMIAKSGWMNTVSRFEAHMSRIAQRNLNQFFRLKADRQGKEDPPPSPVEIRQVADYALPPLG